MSLESLSNFREFNNRKLRFTISMASWNNKKTKSKLIFCLTDYRAYCVHYNYNQQIFSKPKISLYGPSP